jgi:FliI/YscN family ATPase
MNSNTEGLLNLIRHLDTIDPLLSCGEVVESVGLLIRSRGPMATLGDICEIRTESGRPILTQVIGFGGGHVLSMALDEPHGLQIGNRIVARTTESSIPVGPGILGRVLDGFGRPIDNGPALKVTARYPLHPLPPSPLARKPITETLVTGVRAIDTLLPCGKGQRIGIFGGSGVGKSTLLGSLAKHNKADVSVVALIGERNREVGDFINNELGQEGLKKSVVLAATSDRAAPLRVYGCFAALAIAEYFRDQGADVLLVMDSVTRFAMAQREIGLAAGEPPSQKGYPPSVFNLLPKICERAGNFHTGSITGMFTVLVEGDDFNEPISDATRSILDGHIMLSRTLGNAGHFPAIDILSSVSRLASKISSPDQKDASQKIRSALAAYQRTEELIQLGAYVSGANPSLDTYIREVPAIKNFLRQTPDDVAEHQETLKKASEIAKRLPD